MKSFADPIMMTAASDPNAERPAMRILDAIPSDVRVGGEPAKTQSRPKRQAGGGVSEMRPAPHYHGGMAGVAGAPDALGGCERLIAFVGRIAVTASSLLSLYTLLLSVLPQFTPAPTVNFAISPFIITMFAAVMGPVTLYSGFPRSFFGLQTANWKSALAFSVLVSLAFIAAGAALKLILIHTTETFSSLSLFGADDVRENMHQVMMSPLYWLQVGLYLVLTPLQEFVARCCTGEMFLRRSFYPFLGLVLLRYAALRPLRWDCGCFDRRGNCVCVLSQRRASSTG
jgi:hypothetical protein